MADSRDLNLADPSGPSVWDSPEKSKEVPSNAWEYAMRKALKDAAYTSLVYVPVCTHAPVCKPHCTSPTYIWVCCYACCTWAQLRTGSVQD